jgi:four helix bundle protein
VHLGGTGDATGAFMAGVNRFEDLRVWQAARRQGARVGRLIKRRNFNEDRQLVKQISGASVSVMNNISEGFLRRNDPEFSQFLR